jgi:glycosyltransferase involved in cell wall biosynthesis
VPTPLVDVLVPVFNAASTIEESVNSILTQTMQSFRIIIVDDGSTDATPSILRRLAGADARVKVLSKPNSGIVDTLNTGLQSCDAPYLARFDADDIAFSIRLECQLQYLQTHPECVAVGSAVEHIDGRGLPVEGLPQPGPPSLADPRWVPAREPYLIHPYLMARRGSIRAVGGYRFVHNSEDSDLYWRLSEKGVLHNLPEALGYYRMHNDSISGASILNGRIMAVSSQLAAISATRRKAGKPDLEFRRENRDAYRKAGTMDAIVRLASQGLDAAEAEHLRLAASIKLLELAGYRPYEPELSDCSFIRASLAFAQTLPVPNRNEIRWYCTTTAARLAKTGQLALAKRLTPPQFLPYSLAKIFLK